MSIQRGDSLEELQKRNRENGINKQLEEKKENWWIECWKNPTDEDIRLAKEFYRYWEQHKVLPNQVSEKEFKRCFARANAHWSNGEVDEDGNDIYELLDKNSKI